ncbi:M23 family metallopeptidase [Desulfofalx alkaliphila]|uniref:M23 family metallopeptidase n=1 Tax=Desulfofalx alkaliphila TaxID=105483 RepID=UPI0004E15E08|nr:M23 family metallopeptidase [Desulfofalx alkaliphila]
MWPFDSLKQKLKNKDAMEKHREWLKKWLFRGGGVYAAAALMVLVATFTLLKFVVLAPNQPVVKDTGHKAAVESHQQVNEPIEQPKEERERQQAQVDLNRLALPVKGELILTYHQPYFSEQYNDYRISEGLKFAVPEDETVKAALPGKVVDIDQHPHKGFMVIIDHGQGYQTKYSGLSQVQVKVNQEVDQGDILGVEQDSQVEFTLMENGHPINPL